jgi:hypothetical protein
MHRLGLVLYYESYSICNRFETPGPATDEYGNVIGDNTIPIAIIDDVNKEVSSTSYKQQKLPAAYEAFRKKGFSSQTMKSGNCKRG